MSKGIYEPLPDRVEKIAAEIVDAAVQIHQSLGPGLLETVYQSCLCYELSSRKIPFKTEVDVPIIYKNVRLDSGFRLDILVDDSIVLELKSVEKIIPIHEAQLLTYLKLTNTRLGFILNFNVPIMKQGTKRMIL